MKKRFIALLLCCVMLLTLSPSLISAASADDINGTTQSTEGQVPSGEATNPSGTETSTGLQPDATSGSNPPADPQPDANNGNTSAEVENGGSGTTTSNTTVNTDTGKTTTPENEAEGETEGNLAETDGEQPAEQPVEQPVESEIITPTVNFTNVAPFLAPVTGVPQRRAMAKTFSATPRANDTATDNGIVLNKTATANSNGSYTITLEAYATGEKVITEVTEDVPTDIVLVLDQSGSMGNCIVCGKEMDGYHDYHDTYNYTEVTSISTNSRVTYFIKNGSTYAQVYYCNGWHWVDRCEGGAGWYTSPSSEDHTAAAKNTPKTTEKPDGVQFYTRQSTGTESCTSRLSALKSAVTTFANAVAKKAAGADEDITTLEDNVNHRIAVVGFASGNPSSTHYLNSEVFVGANQYQYAETSGETASQHYSDALQSMDTETGQKNITASIAELDANGATYTDLGVEMANGILQANPVPSGEKRNRVVIVFTDGVPGRTGWNNGVADAAIEQSKDIKNSGATVYTVGIFSGADATSAGNQNGTDDQKANWFMQNLSSNNGKVQNPSYYLSAADANSLNDIFQQISDQIETGGSSTTLDENAVIKDIISPQFTLPEGATVNDITLETYKCTGKSDDVYTWSKNTAAMGAKATISGDQVSVTGFDFAENWCGTETNAQGNTTAHGNKLVISFTVSPKAGFLGGNNVYTNTSAGVYENANATNPVLEFERPQVNVPIEDVTVTAEDKNVYLLSNLTADQLKGSAVVKCGDVELKLNESNYGLDAWQTAYVDITVEVKGANGNVVSSDLTNLREDTTYTVSVKVAPKYEALETSSGTSAMAKSNTGTGNINVFKPELTFQDSEVYYGDGVPTEYSNLTATKWKHGTTEANISEMGPAPTLSLIYTPDSTKIADDIINTKQDIAVDVTVKIGTADVTGNTTFQHTNCTGKICNVPVGKEFLLHVKTCQLTITKNGGANNEPYVFTVFKDDEKYSEVTVWGNGTETLVELPVGTYTIEEDTGWSWRYNANNGSAANLNATSPTGTITCTNTANNEKIYWLNGFSTVVKNIFGISTRN